MKDNKQYLTQIAVASALLYLAAAKAANGGNEAVTITLVKPVASEGGSGTSITCGDRGDACTFDEIEKGAVVKTIQVAREAVEAALSRFYSRLPASEVKADTGYRGIVPDKAVFVWRVSTPGRTAAGGVSVRDILVTRPDTEKTFQAVRYLERELGYLKK